jgi:two-component system response regulator FlrC
MNQLLGFQNLKILLAERDSFIRHALQEYFQSKGWLFVAVESAEEGIRLLEKENFDVIVSEYELPGIDGMKFFKRVTIANPNTVKLLITNYGDIDLVSKVLKSDVDDIIEKPFSFEMFLKILVKHIEKKRKD